ncbi:hypothetical protein SAMN05216532_4230 [Streptomyces sp. 2231.1]|uniref:hypothetical protein n=1 Tax=Streptomyces sp. 2231.1 TaxID=1855347 RepID=UPI000898DE64|nr:hypothetical protein [Streptomyces sp. 2231.1]SED33339.1 hypothetical protein SAMN05216532_4230 [Streptomyces sp. 2231.1]
MQRHSGGHRVPEPLPSGPDSRRLRLLALLAVVAAVVALPLTVASGGQVGDAGPAAVRAPQRGADERAGDTAAHDTAAGRRDKDAGARGGDAKIPSAAPSRSPLLLGIGLATAARCGPELSSPEGIEAQTCVLIQGADTWARTYYRNATGESLDSVLSLMGPGGRTVQMHCVTGTDDEPATCETPREHSRGGPDAYTAVAEFAGRGPDGGLLLRSGSNS